MFPSAASLVAVLTSEWSRIEECGRRVKRVSEPQWAYGYLGTHVSGRQVDSTANLDGNAGCGKWGFEELIFEAASSHPLDLLKWFEVVTKFGSCALAKVKLPRASDRYRFLPTLRHTRSTLQSFSRMSKTSHATYETCNQDLPRQIFEISGALSLAYRSVESIH